MATQLAALPAVQRLSPVCIRILGGNPGKFTLQGTNTYLLGSGSRRILLDTGEGLPAWVDSLKSTLQDERATVETALISHWHHDHTGGIQDLLSLAPTAKIYKNDPGPGQHAIVDGQEFRAEGVTLKATFTPGHTKDHIVFVLAEEDAMFTADNVLGHGTAVFEDMGEYLRSLTKMKLMFSGRAYPGHGPVLEDGPAKIAEYIQHRKHREEQVIEAMRDGPSGRPWSAMDIVQVVYREVPSTLHQAARGGVVQILDKLAKDGIVTQQGDGQWQLVRSEHNL